MARHGMDPSASLERKLTDFGSSLPDDERSIFYSILAIAATADEPDVAGFEMHQHRSGDPHVGGGGELNMIQIQSLLSQRALAVSITTGMMQAMNDSQKGIIGNIK